MVQIHPLLLSHYALKCSGHGSSNDRNGGSRSDGGGGSSNDRNGGSRSDGGGGCSNDRNGGSRSGRTATLRWFYGGSSVMVGWYYFDFRVLLRRRYVGRRVIIGW